MSNPERSPSDLQPLSCLPPTLEEAMVDSPLIEEVQEIAFFTHEAWPGKKDFAARLVSDSDYRKQFFSFLIQKGNKYLPESVLGLLQDKDKKTALVLLGAANFGISRAVDFAGAPSVLFLVVSGNLDIDDAFFTSMIPAAARVGVATALQFYYRGRVNLTGAIIASVVPIGGTGLVFTGQILGEKAVKAIKNIRNKNQ